MEGVDFIYGCHLWTPLELGKVAAMPGPFMAAADFFKLAIIGKGGHGGIPHEADRHGRDRRAGGRQPAARRRAPRSTRCRARW